MTEQDEKQLWMEIEHIFDSGANELRVFNMVKGFIEKRYQTLPLTCVFTNDFKQLKKGVRNEKKNTIQRHIGHAVLFSMVENMRYRRVFKKNVSKRKE